MGRTAAHRSHRLMIAIVIAWVFGASVPQAHVQQQAPWDPIAAAYLHGVFAMSLKPVDWDGIDERFATTSVKFRHGSHTSVYAQLKPVSEFAGTDFAAAIRAAIAAKDAAALRTVSTRAVASAVRHHLARARANLGGGGLLRREILRARAIFAAFDGYLRDTDPEGHRRLGIAWLELTTAVTDKDVDRVRKNFEPAATTISSYLIDHFEKRTPDVAARAEAWLPPDADLADQDPLPRLVLNAEERGIDETDLFLVAYGDMLFDSPEIFGEPARHLGLACSTCHNRSDINQRFYIPGLSRDRGGVDVDSSFFNARANDHRFDPLDIPSLRGIRFTAPYGRDGRIASLREFARNVIVNEFAGPEPTPMMLDAMIAYLNEFDFLPAPFLYRNGRLNTKASAAAKRGERLFFRTFAGMKGKSCANCHLPTANFV